MFVARGNDPTEPLMGLLPVFGWTRTCTAAHAPVKRARDADPDDLVRHPTAFVNPFSVRETYVTDEGFYSATNRE
jgi:hypothetical protein